MEMLKEQSGWLEVRIASNPDPAMMDKEIVGANALLARASLAA